MIKNAFAIKVGRTTNDKLFAKLLKDLVKEYGNFTVENLTHEMRPTVEVQSIRRTIFGNEVVAKKKNLDYLTIGFSDTFDVSFEEKSALHIGPFPLVKIYDITKDFITVIEKLGEYIANNHAIPRLLNIVEAFKVAHIVVESRPETVIVKHSCFAEVNGQPVAYNYKKPQVGGINELLSQLLNR